MTKSTDSRKQPILFRAGRKAKRMISNLFSTKPPERHENPFATLLPVLTALATQINAHRVIEFGCGRNSTLNFLSKEIFPELVQLTSVENDAEWREIIVKQANDTRLSMIQLVPRTGQTPYVP